METPQSVIEFWFSETTRPKWFKSTKAFDRALKERYLSLWERARDGGLDHWRETPEGALALVIVLDQFPLNMFRDEPLGFSTEAASRRVAAEAIEKGFDREMSDEQKAFLYLPFMHSESLADQDRSVALFEAAGLNDNLKWARHHREIIRRFGRFPHRNEILGRESSEEEVAYLASKEAFLG
ncbi:MAG: DUF924 family protein [Gammaproteobacteria bacterium]